MAIYGLGVRTVCYLNTSYPYAVAELATSATSTARVTEIDVSLSTGNVAIFGVGRSAAIGVNPVNAQSGELEDPNAKSSLAKVAIQWGTPPTSPASGNYLFRIDFAAVAGMNIQYTFPRGIVLSTSSGLHLMSLASGSFPVDVNYNWDE